MLGPCTAGLVTLGADKTQLVIKYEPIIRREPRRGAAAGRPAVRVGTEALPSVRVGPAAAPPARGAHSRVCLRTTTCRSFLRFVSFSPISFISR